MGRTEAVRLKYSNKDRDFCPSCVDVPLVHRTLTRSFASNNFLAAAAVIPPVVITRHALSIRDDERTSTRSTLEVVAS
jgi:hypothetical protein